MSNILLIFAKSPEPGKVKTRIGKTMGMNNAAKIYSELLKTTLLEVKDSSFWKSIIYITPDSNQKYFAHYNIDTKIQQGDDLGGKLINSFSEASLLNPEKIIVIGSDCPELTSIDIKKAFYTLDSSPAVIGPTDDGGFYLFGINTKYIEKVKEIFNSEVKWSTEIVFKQVKKVCAKTDLPLHILDKKRDIDTENDWVKYLELER